MGLRAALASSGLTIFLKYVPGRVLSIVGRAAYISRARGVPLARVSALSLEAVVISVWVGLVLSVSGFWIWEGVFLGRWITVAFALLAGIALFHQEANLAVSRCLGLIFRKTYRLPKLSAREILLTAPWFLGCWILWGAGFYCLVRAFHPGSVPLAVGFAMPLSITLGIVSVVFPGGLGFREGILAGILTMEGISTDEAIAIALFSRIWFLGGECFHFILGWIAHRSLVREFQESPN